MGEKLEFIVPGSAVDSLFYLCISESWLSCRGLLGLAASGFV